MSANINSRSFLLIVFPSSFELVAIAEHTNSSSCHVSYLSSEFEWVCFVCVRFTFSTTVLPVSNVFLSIGKDVLTIAISLAVCPITIVSSTVLPNHFSLSISLAVFPFAIVESSFPRVVCGVRQGSFTVVLVGFPRALVLLAVLPYQRSSSLCQYDIISRRKEEEDEQLNKARATVKLTNKDERG